MEQLRDRVAELESELKKARRGMANAAKKFKVQEQNLAEAQKLSKEHKRTVKDLTAKLNNARGSHAPSQGHGHVGVAVDDVVDTDFVNFTLAQVFKLVQAEFRARDSSDFQAIESEKKFQAASIKVVKNCLRNNSGGMVKTLQDYAKQRSSKRGDTRADSDSDSVEDFSTSGTSPPNSTNPPASATSTHQSPVSRKKALSTATRVNTSSAARLPYCPLVKSSRTTANHVHVTLHGSHNATPLKFTVACVVPFYGTPGGATARRASSKNSASKLDKLPPVVRTAAEFGDFATFLRREFPNVHVPKCLVQLDAGITVVAGAVQQAKKTSAVKYARDAEYHLQMWLEHIMAHPLFGSFGGLKEFLTQKGRFNVNVASQFDGSSVSWPSSVTDTPITNAEVHTAIHCF